MATLSQIEEEDNEIYAYVVLGAICIGFLLLLTQLYYANYDLVQRLHIDIPFLDKHVFSKEGMKLLLGDSYKVRNVVLFLFAFSLTSPSKRETDVSLAAARRTRHFRCSISLLSFFLTYPPYHSRTVIEYSRVAHQCRVHPQLLWSDYEVLPGAG